MPAPWKTAWITGGSTGIGRELAVKLAGDSVRVAVSARSVDALDALAAAHKGMVAVPVDVIDRSAVAAAYRRVVEAIGPVDLAILNAGVWHPMPASRRGMLRRHAQSKLIGLLEHLLAILWALAAVLALIGSHLWLVAAVLALGTLWRSRRLRNGPGRPQRASALPAPTAH